MTGPQALKVFFIFFSALPRGFPALGLCNLLLLLSCWGSCYLLFCYF